MITLEQAKHNVKLVKNKEELVKVYRAVERASLKGEESCSILMYLNRANELVPILEFEGFKASTRKSPFNDYEGFLEVCW